MKHFPLRSVIATICAFGIAPSVLAGNYDCKYNVYNELDVALEGLVLIAEGNKLYVNDGELDLDDLPQKDGVYIYEWRVKENDGRMEVRVVEDGNDACALGATIHAENDPSNQNYSELGYGQGDIEALGIDWGNGTGGEVDCETTGDSLYVGDFLGKYGCACDGNVRDNKKDSRVTINCPG